MKRSDDIPNPNKPNEKIGKFQRFLPQIIATAIGNLHKIDMGFSSAIPTIAIAALTARFANDQNRNESLSMSAVEASWMVSQISIGSIGYAFLPLGSLVSGYFSDRLGRKRAMIVANIPFAIGWLLLYQSTEVWHIFAGQALLALTEGAVITSNLTYISEICEPSVRGILISCCRLTSSFGAFVAYTLNTLLPWRKIAMVGSTIPILSAISLFLIPETPHWLLSKNRTKQAEKSLCWLRGWVSRDTVAQEFSTLQQHSERSNSCNSCIKLNLRCSHPPPTWTGKLDELKRKRTLKSFVILFLMFFINQFSGLLAMEPFLIQIFRAYKSPISADKAVAGLSFSGISTSVILIGLIRFIGKRRIYLTMAFGAFLSSLVISCYGFIYLPSGYTSFNQQNQSFHLENQNLAYIPTIGLFLWDFCSCFTVPITWMMLTELFPFKSRGIASGIAGSINYSLGFISKKTYFNLETTLSMAGVSLLYCIIAGIGLISMYFILPETEGRSLEDIELHFSDNSKKLTDRKIASSIEYIQNKHLSNEKMEKCESTKIRKY